MHKDIIKGSLKVIMRRIRQQWGNFTDEEIAQIQGHYEEHEHKLKHEHRYHKEQLRALKNL